MSSILKISLFRGTALLEKGGGGGGGGGGDAHFGGVGPSLLQRSVSDHFPILLERGGGLVRGSLPFRFENMWISDERFKDLIKDWW